ncbi:tetratricopeptide repeat protein [Allotamlana fucoidanivorans]|nr:hypothetical protein [Tamlana fucoidanivorans]
MITRNSLVLYFKNSLSALLVVLFISCQGNYKEQIPVVPDLNNIPESLKNQVIHADDLARKKTTDENLGNLGMVYYASNYYIPAAKCFELANIINPKSWQWLYYKGLLHIELGESALGLKAMKSVVDIQPKVWNAWYQLGEIYRQMDSTEQATDVFKRITSLDAKYTYVRSSNHGSYLPLQVFSKLSLSKVYMMEKANDKAERELQELTRTYKSFGPAYRELGNLYALKGDRIKAEKYKERANDLRVFSLPIDTLKDNLSLMSKSEAFVLKQIDDAMSGSDSKWTNILLQHARKNIPDSKYVLSKVIRQNLAQGTGEQILSLLDRHILLFKDNYKEILQIGIALGDAGFKKESSRYFEEGLSFESNTPNQKSTLAGLFYEKANNKERAVEIMKEVATSNFSDVHILGDALFLMIQTGFTDIAKAYYARLRMLSPNDASVKIYEGINEEKKDNVFKAISLFMQAFNAEPKNKYLIKHLTDLFMTNGMWEDAEDFFRRALSFYPNDSELQMYLGWVLVSYPQDRVADLKEGIEFSERAFYNSRYKTNNRVSAGRNIAVGYYQLKNKEMALQYINQTIGLALKYNIDENYVNGLKNLAEQFSSEMNG